MNFSVDKYLPKRYNTKTYNCWDFVREVWLELKNQDVGYRTPTAVTLVGLREQISRERSKFKKLSEPQDPCIVVFNHPKIIPHIGVYYKGKVLHLPEGNSGRYEPLDVAGSDFKGQDFYLPCL